MKYFISQVLFQNNNVIKRINYSKEVEIEQIDCNVDN